MTRIFLCLYLLLATTVAGYADITGRLTNFETSPRLRSMRFVTISLSLGGEVVKTTRPTSLGFYRFGEFGSGTYTVTPIALWQPFVFEPEFRIVTDGETADFQYARYNPCLSPC